MKVVFAVHHFPPRYTGGAEWETYRVAAALRERGHAVSIICVERIDAGTADGVTWEDDSYDGLPVRRLSFNLAAAPDPFRWEYDNLWIGDHLRAFLAEHQPDVFHLVSGYLMSGRPIRVARELGIPVVVTLSDFWFLCRRITLLRSDGQISSLPIAPQTCARCLGEESRRYRWLRQIAPPVMDVFWQRQTKAINRFEARQIFLRESLNQADAIISRSQFVRSVFIEAEVEADRILFSRQGRDFSNLTPELLRKTTSTELRIGYLGQIASHKGVHVLFEAGHVLTGLPLTIKAYGDPTPFPAYSARLRQLTTVDRRLELAGVIPPEQLTDVFRSFDVIVVPSLWYENSPTVILEAFAHQTPVVASDQGGMAELVQHGQNGLLFKSGDVADLAKQLKRLLDEPGLLPQLRRGISPVKTLSQEMDELEDVYHGIVAERISPPA